MTLCKVQIGEQSWWFEINPVKEVDGITYRQESSAFVCPVCLQVWAAIMLNAPSTYSINGHTCETCNHETVYNRVPGSILSESGMLGRLNRGLLVQLPLSLLRREFDLHWKFCIERTPIFETEYQRAVETLGEVQWQESFPTTTSQPLTKPQEKSSGLEQPGITQMALSVFA